MYTSRLDMKMTETKIQEATASVAWRGYVAGRNTSGDYAATADGFFAGYAAAEEMLTARNA